VLGLLRVLLLSGLGLANRRRERRTVAPAGDETALHSVLIPAYNEALVIRNCIAKVLASRHRALEVIVVDDGSTDGTAEVVREAFGGDDRVRLVRTANGGKAHALNVALRQARGAVLVALDADTQFQPDTVTRLVRWFDDPAVAAVAGNAKVGNRINFLTRCQTLEYVTAQNLERRALARLGCVTVVPGAVGAWRRDAVERLGGFPTDTLAEDQDLTMALQKAGHRVLFDSTAVAWTEVPDRLRGLLRQRFRWAFGTLQCLWKHRRATLRPRYGALGLVALPQIWLFQLVFSLIAPIIDAVLLWRLAGSGLDAWQHGPEFDADGLRKTAMFYALFLAVDFAAGALAFLLEKHEPYRLLWWLVPQRFGYRQLMCFVVAKAAVVAVAGVFVGWGRSDRKATVEQPAPAE
jgi:cellulose synthase/poly-beta-1,6-N-acetylglucosamine synthase-like glycosyltransferase